MICIKTYRRSLR